MNLSRQEIERFYGIWLPLLHYVNAQRQLTRFLRDTNRIDWDRAEAMQRLLKQR